MNKEKHEIERMEREKELELGLEEKEIRKEKRKEKGGEKEKESSEEMDGITVVKERDTHSHTLSNSANGTVEHLQNLHLESGEGHRMEKEKVSLTHKLSLSHTHSLSCTYSLLQTSLYFPHSSTSCLWNPKQSVNGYTHTPRHPPLLRRTTLFSIPSQKNMRKNSSRNSEWKFREWVSLSLEGKTDCWVWWTSVSADDRQLCSALQVCVDVCVCGCVCVWMCFCVCGCSREYLQMFHFSLKSLKCPQIQMRSTL